MKKLPLSVLSTACILAITACSSNSKGDENYKALVESKLTQSAAEAKQKSEAKLAELQTSVTDLETKLADAEKAGTASAAEVKALQDELTKAKADLTEAAKIKDANTKTIADLEAQLAAANALLAAIDDKQRLAANIAQIKTAFVDNGTAENTSKVSGAAAVIENGVIKVQNVAADTTHNLNTLVVDGTPLVIFSEEFIKAERQKAEDASWKNPYKAIGITDIVKDGKTIGKKGSLPNSKYGDGFDLMRWGYYTENGKTVLFVQGHLSTETEGTVAPLSFYRYLSDNQVKQTIRVLPKSGIYSYAGSAFYGKDADYQEYNTVAYADFAEKKVKVKLQENDADKLSFGGTISGNQIEGTVNGIVTKAAFYGTTGTDIGGVFYNTAGDDKDKNGVFGVTKQGWGTTSDEKVIKEIKEFDPASGSTATAQ